MKKQIFTLILLSIISFNYIFPAIRISHSGTENNVRYENRDFTLSNTTYGDYHDYNFIVSPVYLGIIPGEHNNQYRFKYFNLEIENSDGINGYRIKSKCDFVTPDGGQSTPVNLDFLFVKKYIDSADTELLISYSDEYVFTSNGNNDTRFISLPYGKTEIWTPIVSVYRIGSDSYGEADDVRITGFNIIIEQVENNSRFRITSSCTASGTNNGYQNGREAPIYMKYLLVRKFIFDSSQKISKSLFEDQIPQYCYRGGTGENSWPINVPGNVPNKWSKFNSVLNIGMTTGVNRNDILHYFNITNIVDGNHFLINTDEYYTNYGSPAKHNSYGLCFQSIFVKKQYP